MLRVLLFVVLTIHTCELFAAPTPATPEDYALRDRIMGAWAVAYGQVGYELKAGRFTDIKMPDVEIVSQAEICERAFVREANQPPLNDCDIAAVTVQAENGKVYLSNKYEWNGVRNMSIVVHEFIHTLQTRSGFATAMTCEDWIQREEMAYKAQTHVLEQAGDEEAAKMTQDGLDWSRQQYYRCKDRRDRQG